MDKYVIAPPEGSTNNGVGAVDRHWKKGYFDELPGYNEYLAESTGYGIVSGCTPTISGLTVSVASGVVHLANGTRKEISASTVTLDTADTTNPRIDLVYITSAGVVAKVTGTASATPSVPALPSGGISVAQVSVAASASTGTLADMRGMLARWYNSGVVNVKDFGAVGDGVTDDTAAIQAALQEGEGKTILFPKGTYITSETLNFSAQIIDGDNSIIEYTGNDKAINILDGWTLKVYNLSVKGTNNATYGIYANGALNASLLNNIFILGGFQYGIYLLQAWQSRLDGIYIYNCSTVGLYINQGYNCEVHYLRACRCPINVFLQGLLSCAVQTVDCSYASNIAMQINGCNMTRFDSIYYEDDSTHKANKVFYVGTSGSEGLTFQNIKMSLEKENTTYFDLEVPYYQLRINFKNILIVIGNTGQTVMKFPTVTSYMTRDISFENNMRINDPNSYTYTMFTGYATFITHDNAYASMSWVILKNSVSNVKNRLMVDPGLTGNLSNVFDGVPVALRHYKDMTTWGYYTIKESVDGFKGFVELITKVGKSLYWVDTTAENIWTLVETTIPNSYSFVGYYTDQKKLMLHQSGGTTLDNVLLRVYGDFS